VKTFSQCGQCIGIFSFFQVPTCQQVIKVFEVRKGQSRKNKKKVLECSRPKERTAGAVGKPTAKKSIEDG
jgi:hypothetical protein